WLAEALLPLARWELEQQRAARKAKQGLVVHENRQLGGLRKLNGRQLSWDRLLDLRLLIDLRGGIGEGHRMKFLFWQMNFMALSGQVTRGNFWKEAQALVWS
ncbi:MAG: replication protein, partial [Aeromonas sp.]